MSAPAACTYSSITTASQPSGTTPPVAIDTASPGASAPPVQTSPMGTAPRSVKNAGTASDAPWVSRARTA
jgi:hypothetical protein